MDKLVTVLMSVHNEKREYLQTAISSIIGQTYKHIEFLIIDDASEKACHDALEEIIRPNPFIKLLVNEKNLGIAKSLHNGVKQAQGDYIARMDADDFSLPMRLEKQVRFLEQNPKIDIVGGSAISFGTKSVFMSPCSGMDDDEIKSELFFTSALCHPAVMIRKSFLQQNNLNYDPNVNKGQDYDLWERCSVYGRFTILKDMVLYYRIHDKQITSQNKSEQVQTADMVMKRRLGRIGLEPTAEEYKAHLALKGTSNYDNLTQVKDWAEKLITANAQAGLVDGKTFEKNIRKRLSIFCAKQKKVRGRDVIPLLQYGKERIAIMFRLKKERVYVSQIDERKCLF